jgi:hypothetical protein
MAWFLSKKRRAPSSITMPSDIPIFGEDDELVRLVDAREHGVNLLFAATDDASRLHALLWTTNATQHVIDRITQLLPVVQERISPYDPAFDVAREWARLAIERAKAIDPFCLEQARLAARLGRSALEVKIDVTRLYNEFLGEDEPEVLSQPGGDARFRAIDPPPAGPASTAPYPGGRSVVAVLHDVGPRRIAVVKRVREATDLSLKEAKALVDCVPVQPMSLGYLDLYIARRLRDALAAVGARLEIDDSELRRSEEEVLRRNQEDELIAAAKAVQADRKRRADVEWAKRVIEEGDEPGRNRRSAIPTAVRHLVWQRDGGKCTECGSTERLELDHVIPVAMGGSNTERNLQLLCEQCNRRKGKSLG